MATLESIVLELGASSGAVMVVDETAQVLRCADSYNMPNEWIQITNPLDETTLNGKAYITGEPVMANNLNTEVAGYPVGSVLITPLKDGVKIVGTVELITADPRITFDSQAQKKLEQAAGHMVAS